MIKCKVCGTANSPDSSVCIECGSDLRESRRNTSTDSDKEIFSNTRTEGIAKSGEQRELYSSGEKYERMRKGAVLEKIYKQEQAMGEVTEREEPPEPEEVKPIVINRQSSSDIVRKKKYSSKNGRAREAANKNYKIPQRIIEPVDSQLLGHKIKPQVTAASQDENEKVELTASDPIGDIKKKNNNSSKHKNGTSQQKKQRNSNAQSGRQNSESSAARKEKRSENAQEDKRKKAYDKKQTENASDNSSAKEKKPKLKNNAPAREATDKTEGNEKSKRVTENQGEAVKAKSPNKKPRQTEASAKSERSNEAAVEKATSEKAAARKSKPERVSFNEAAAVTAVSKKAVESEDKSKKASEGKKVRTESQRFSEGKKVKAESKKASESKTVKAESQRVPEDKKVKAKSKKVSEGNTVKDEPQSKKVKAVSAEKKKSSEKAIEKEAAVKKDDTRKAKKTNPPAAPVKVKNAEKSLNDGEKKPTTKSRVLGSDFTDSDIESNKNIAALSYIGVLLLIPLIKSGSSKFCKAHTRQGIAVFIYSLIISLVTLTAVIGLRILLLWQLGLSYLIYNIAATAIGILMLILLLVPVFSGAVAAFSGTYKSVPIVGKFVNKRKN